MKRFPITLFLLICFVLFQSSYTYAGNSTNTDNLLKLSLVDIINIPWGSSLEELKEKYPGGRFYKGDSQKTTVSNYFFYVHLTDISKETGLNFFNPPRSNYIETKQPKLIKDLHIDFENQESTKEAIEIMKRILDEHFPQGGPSWKDNKQVGYFIPLDNDFNGISLMWSINQEEHKINITIQKNQ